ncbi:MAG: type II CRISPR-associated endonuclease Cas1 [Alistipes putredinis]|nr:MAG: type II CRISPR-associated endonuclease Cas1 [Alistipes putredinis]
MGKDGDKLKPFYMNVKSGDADNREAIAAKIYWTELFGRDFIRLRDGVEPNNLLNYGYTILRAAVARSLMGSGLFPAFGIFHRNRYNSFPLADDIMEPYRPYVDETVYDIYRQGITESHARNQRPPAAAAFRRHPFRPRDKAARRRTDIHFGIARQMLRRQTEKNCLSRC